MTLPQKKKVKMKLPYDSVILHLGIYPKELKAGIQNDIFHPHSYQHYSQQQEVEPTQLLMEG